MSHAGPPSVLLCDAAFSAIPILLALKRKGFRVAVCGGRPQDPGHALADQSYAIDYSDRERMLQLMKSERFEFVVPGCTDVSYLTCSWLAHELGLPGYDSIDATYTLHRKDAFRKFCASHRFPIPRAIDSIAQLSLLRFPILIKPADAFSGRGISKVEREADVHHAVARARLESKSDAFVFEEFVDGDLFSHSAFIRDGKVVADFFVREFCTVHPYQVNGSYVCTDLSESVANGMRKWLERCAGVLKLGDGLVHTQFIAAGESFYLIEVMRRCPGDLYSLLVSKSTSEDYSGMYAGGFCVEAPRPAARVERASRHFARHTVSVREECVYVSTKLALPEAVSSFVPLKKVGEVLRPAPLDRAGIFFCEFNSAEEMKIITPHLMERVCLEAWT